MANEIEWFLICSARDLNAVAGRSLGSGGRGKVADAARLRMVRRSHLFCKSMPVRLRYTEISADLKYQLAGALRIQLKRGAFMAIESRGYDPRMGRSEQQLELFGENLDLILEHGDSIVRCKDYFFCAPEFAWCSWAWVGGDGPLPMGYLLLGWSEGMLAEMCSGCGGTLLIVSFGGSILNGSSSWFGVCVACRRTDSSRNQLGDPGSKARRFLERRNFVAQLRRQYPASVSEWQQYDGYIFSWGGNGLQPARKKRLVTRYCAEPVLFEELLAELRDGSLRSEDPPNVSLLREEMRIKLQSRNATTINIGLKGRSE